MCDFRINRRRLPICLVFLLACRPFGAGASSTAHTGLLAGGDSAETAYYNPAAIGNLDGAEIEIENVLPQRLQAGLFHRFPSGRLVTADAVWIDFSEFSTGAISVEDRVVISPQGIYDDIYGITIGAGFPIDDLTTFKIGGLYLTPAVDDDRRTLSLRLDRVWVSA